MKRMGPWCGVVVMLAVAFASAVSAAPAGPASAAGWPKIKSVTFQVYHRVFQNFHDEVTAPLKQEFRVGDSEFTGRIIDWVPDFDMDIKAHKVTSRGAEPKNPAFRIVVRKNNVPQDTVWAFVNMPPHFARKSLLAFLTSEVQFVDRAPIVSNDSLAVRARQVQKELKK